MGQLKTAGLNISLLQQVHLSGWDLLMINGMLHYMYKMKPKQWRPFTLAKGEYEIG